MTMSHYVVGIVGIGYLVVGVEQYIRGNTGPAIV